MKAGTSWLFELLRDHPDLDTVPIKEIHYLWDKHGTFPMLTFDQRKETVRFHINALLASCGLNHSKALLRWCEMYLREPIDDAWFASLYLHRAERRYCAEFSNMNALLDDDGWQHVRALCNTVRIIYTIREPLDRLWSHVSFQATIVGKTDELSNYSVSQFMDFMIRYDCLRHGCYAEVINKLQTHFEEREWKLLFFDDITARPAALVRDVEAFLDIQSRNIALEKLAHVHSATAKGPMPAAFRSAARQHVEAELEALQRQGTKIPEGWSRPHAF